LSPDQFFGTGRGRPGKADARAEVIPFGGWAACFVASGVARIGKSWRASGEDLRGFVARSPAGNTDTAELMVAVRGFYVPGQAIIQREIVGDLPAVLPIDVVLVGAGINDAARGLRVLIGDTGNKVEDGVSRTVGSGAVEAVVAVVVGEV